MFLRRRLALGLIVFLAAGLVATWVWPRRRPTPQDARSSPPGREVSPGSNIGPIAKAPRLVRQAYEITFTEVPADEAGITFVHNSGDSSEKPFPAANGSGVAVLDYDLDGRMDLYFLTGTPIPPDPKRPRPINRLYRNAGSWRFEDVSSPARLADDGFSAGAAVGDFNSDGFPDVYVNCFGPNRLFCNQGDGTFAEIASAAHVANEQWGSSAAFFDYDADGLLDLFVCNYARWTLETNRYCGDPARGLRIFCSPTLVEPAPCALYHNSGSGSFQDATAPAGLSERRFRAQGVVAADFDDDGLMDLFIGNDLHPNSLFINVGGARFRDMSETSGAAHDDLGANQAGMGVDAADANRDGRLDLFVTNFAGEHNSYYENLGHDLFQEVSRLRGLAADSTPYVGWGTTLTDFDLDGWPDVLVTNGHTDDNLADLGRDTPYRQPPGLWRNESGRFSFAGARPGSYFARPHAGRGLAVGDLDNDGDADVVLAHRDSAPGLLRNERTTSGRADRSWIRLQFIGVHANRDAVGTALAIESVEPPQVQQIKGGGSYLSASELRQLVAVPPEAASISIVVRWPGGRRDVVRDLQPGASYQVIEPATMNGPPRVVTVSASAN